MRNVPLCYSTVATIVAGIPSTTPTRFVTDDGGASWRKLPDETHTVIFHPTKPRWMLFSRWLCGGVLPKNAPPPRCVHSLYFSLDLGKTSRLVTAHVLQFAWAAPGPHTGSNSPATSIGGSTEIEETLFFSHVGGPGGPVAAPQPRLKIPWSSENIDFCVSRNLGRSYDTVIKGGNKFGVFPGYIFVSTLASSPSAGGTPPDALLLGDTEDSSSRGAAVGASAGDTPPSSSWPPPLLVLLVSTDDGRTFRRASIGDNHSLPEQAYFVLDTNIERGVLLHVAHGRTDDGAEVGTIYVSDNQAIHFLPSLGNNLRGADGMAAFSSLGEGVYLANQAVDRYSSAGAGGGGDWVNAVGGGEVEIEPEDGEALEEEFGADGVAAMVGSGVHRARHGRTRVRTLITFNQGGSWQVLPAPSEESQKEECRAAPGSSGGGPRLGPSCSLHLHLGSPSSDSRAFSPVVVSVPTTGIIFATGGVSAGLYLDDVANSLSDTMYSTFSSLDGGRSWHLAHQHAHNYLLGDAAGLALMTQLQTRTRLLLFSTDYGVKKSWLEFELIPRHRKPIIADGLTAYVVRILTCYLLVWERGTRRQDGLLVWEGGKGDTSTSLTSSYGRGGEDIASFVPTEYNPTFIRTTYGSDEIRQLRWPGQMAWPGGLSAWPGRLAWSSGLVVWPGRLA